jgi:hypothetical protein
MMSCAQEAVEMSDIPPNSKPVGDIMAPNREGAIKNAPPPNPDEGHEPPVMTASHLAESHKLPSVITKWNNAYTQFISAPSINHMTPLLRRFVPRRMQILGIWTKITAEMRARQEAPGLRGQAWKTFRNAFLHRPTFGVFLMANPDLARKVELSRQRSLVL